MSLSQSSCRVLAIASIFALVSTAVRAQITGVNSTTLTPVPGSGHDYIRMLNETVNPYNGSPSVRIEIPIPRGRSLTVPFGLAYDANGVHFTLDSGVGGYWSSNVGSISKGGWSYTLPQVTYTGATKSFPNAGPPYSCDYNTNYIFYDPSGGRHNLVLNTSGGSGDSRCFNLSARLNGGDVHYLANLSADYSTVTVSDLDGTTYKFTNGQCLPGYNLCSYQPFIEDRNGNTITVTSTGGGGAAFNVTDTVGRTVLSSSGFGATGNTLSVPGVAQPYTLTWGTATSNFTLGFTSPIAGETCANGTNGFPSHDSETQPVITAITLPNGQQYRFSYDPTYGLLNQITYPTGGWIRYAWGINPQSEFIPYGTSGGGVAACRVDWFAIVHRYVSFDGTNVALQQDFSYSTTWDATDPSRWNTKQTTVTDRDLLLGTTFATTYAYAPSIVFSDDPLNQGAGNQIPIEQTITYKDGSGNTLRTVSKNWYNMYLLQTEQTTLNNNLTSKRTYSYVSPGAGVYQALITETDEYDYGQGAPGPLLRKTVTNYTTFPATPIYPFALSILDRPSSVITYDGTGNRVAETDYAYDQTSVASASATQHDETNYSAAYNNRGNATTVTKQCFPSCTNAVTTLTYDETGQVLTAVDACGNAACGDMTGTNHTTTYSYADSYTVLSGGANVSYTPTSNTNAFLTQITDPLTHTQNFTYDFNNGQLTVSKDPNALSTTYIYNDSLARPTQANSPDGGQTTVSYSDNAPSPSVTTTKKLTGSSNLVSVTAMDGIGHTIQTQLTSDPNGADYADSTYDGLGRAFTRSNPHRTSALPTDGTTTYLYDAIGRPCVLIPPDGTSVAGNACPSSQPINDVFTSYSGNTTTVTDQSGNGRKSVTDALGRLIEVDEPGATSAGISGTGSGSVSGSEQSIGGAPATSGTGSVVFSGTLQSKQVQTQAAASGRGTVTINGSEQSVFYCPYTCTTVYDGGNLQVTVNNVSFSTGWNSSSTADSVASALASALNSSSSPVTASVSGNVVTLVAKTTGAATNYSLSASVTDWNRQFFSNPSFTPSPSGSALTGGRDAAYTTVYDSGNSTVTVNGHNNTISWSGSGTTTSSIASALATSINADSSASVTASASGSIVNLTAKTTGASTNYSLASSWSYDSADFSISSFTSSNSGSALTGGSNGTATAYDSGNVWIQVTGFQATVGYGQSDTPTSLTTALTNALNVSASPVTASASGTTINLTAKAAGSRTNYALSGGSSTSQPGTFAQTSFSISVSGATLTGGTEPPLSLSTPAVATYNYDALDNLSSVVQSGSRQRSFTYDSFSRLLSATNPESGTITYSYDANGNLSSKTAPAPNQPGALTVITTFTYDALNRLTQKSFSDATPTIKYGYDGVAPAGCTLPSLTINNGIGKRTGMCDAAGAEAWSYDINVSTGWRITDGRTTNNVTLTTVVQNNFDGSLNSVTYPSGHVVSYGYNAAARYTSATDTTSNITYAASANYWPSGLLGAISNGGLSATYIYNSRLQPCWIYSTTSTALPWNTTACTSTATTGNILDLKYNFNLGSADNGNVVGITNNRDTARSQTFSYDRLNRLSIAQTTSTYSTGASRCWGEALGYDAWGNLLSISPSSASYNGCSQEPFQGWTVTAKNQLQNSVACFDASGNLLTTATYCYDAAGNLLTDTARSYTYDAENNLKSVPMLNIGYLYDGDGRRVAKLNSSNQAYKLYWYGMGTDPLDETDATGAANNSNFYEYLFFGGKRIARRDSTNTVNYYFADHLGTARILANSSGTVLDDSDFYPFGGERIVTSSGGNNYKFTGKERDAESGLDNFGARYDSSSMGRFMSPDPLGGRLIDPQTLNKYSYVRNNPVNLVDPTGLYTCKDDNNKCQTDQDKAFEKARQQDLKSKDPNVVRAAKAYGDPTKDNGVGVQFGDPGKGNNGITSNNVRVDPNDPTQTKLQAEETVTIRSGLSGADLAETVGHEGSHVADAQDFVATIDIKTGGADQSKNLTKYATELAAYLVSQSILASANEKRIIGDCGVNPCVLGTGILPAQVRDTINRLLANPNGYGVTPDKPGPVMYPNLTTPK